MTALLLLPASFFVLLGVAAHLRPGQLLQGFGIVVATADGRNEIRAVYGGFPLALAAMLCVPFFRPELTAGIVATAAAATLGMAVGRLISVCIDRRFGRFPLLFTVVELVIAATLGIALVQGRV